MCAMVCQFGAISAHPRTGIAVKCDFCPDRLKRGLTPACVEACPTQALLYGEEEDLSRAKRSASALAVARAVGRTAGLPADTSPLGVLRSLGGK
jgi:carbon-monoxide dehydrogenase iron sulfur subunit